MPQWGQSTSGTGWRIALDDVRRPRGQDHPGRSAWSCGCSPPSPSTDVRQPEPPTRSSTASADARSRSRTDQEPARPDRPGRPRGQSSSTATERATSESALARGRRRASWWTRTMIAAVPASSSATAYIGIGSAARDRARHAPARVRLEDLGGALVASFAAREVIMSDDGDDLQRRRRRRTRGASPCGRRSSKRTRYPDGTLGLHAARGREPAGLLRVRAPVHEHARRWRDAS